MYFLFTFAFEIGAAVLRHPAALGTDLEIFEKQPFQIDPGHMEQSVSSPRTGVVKTSSHRNVDICRTVLEIGFP